MSKNPYSYSQATFYSSSSSLDADGHRTTTSWRGGYGKENKDGETRFFVLPSEGDNFVQSNEEEYNKTREIANSKFSERFLPSSREAPSSIEAPSLEVPQLENSNETHVESTEEKQTEPRTEVSQNPPNRSLQHHRRLRNRMFPWSLSHFDSLFPDFFRDDIFGEHDEIDRLRRENRELRKQLSRR